MVRKKKVKPKKNYTASIVVISFILGAVFTFGLYEFMIKEKVGITSVNTDNLEEYEGGERVAYVNVPALNREGNGVTTTLVVKVKDGTGKTLVDINSLLFWIDTQNSIRMAKLVAENYTGIDLDGVDLVYSVNANASLIGGESAGAALTIATIAALQDLDVNQNIAITGTINHDGTIGPVGGVLEKAKAAGDVGVDKFLVPLLQSSEITYEEHEHCEKFGLLEWCSVERIPKKVDIQAEAGVSVVEVETIGEAIDHFTSS